MPATRQTSRRHLRRPWAGVLLALALLSAFVDGAAGVTKEEVADAEARVTRLEREIRARETRLEILQEVAASLAAELSLAQGELERIGWELSETRARLATAQSKYERLRARLDGRAREAYMDGPASGLEFLLGSTSLADLSDRIEFVNSVVQADAELASRVGNVENRLAKEARLLDVLRTRKADYVGRLRRQGDELTSRLSEQLAILEDIDANRARAERLARKSQNFRASIRYSRCRSSSSRSTTFSPGSTAASASPTRSPTLMEVFICHTPLGYALCAM